jgi:hypothetical protein
MATVTGLTATRMLAIEAASVVSGTVNGSNHLILTKHDGSTIDAGALENADMTLSTNQTVTGTKTYNAGKLLDKGSMVYNVKAFGALGDNTTDDTAAIQSAIDTCAAAGGGIVWFPWGTYKLVTNPLKLYSGASPTITAYSNITLAGTGSATLSQTTTGVNVVQAINDAANGAQSKNVTIENLTLNFAGTATNSGHGVYAKQQASNGPPFMQWSLKNVNVTNCQGTGKYGFNFESLIVSTLERCIATECANGFYLNGEAFGGFTSINTSLTFQNCYANMGVNGVYGYRISNTTYSTFEGCAADFGNNGTTAYLIECGNSLKFSGCGFELGGTNTLAAGFRIKANAAAYGGGNNVFDACYGFLSKNTKEIWIAGYGGPTTVTGYQSNSSVSGSTGIYLEDYVELTETSCSLTGLATARYIDPYSIYRTPGKPRVEAYASSATPTPRGSSCDWLVIYGATVNMTVGAPTGTPDDGAFLTITYRDSGVARTIAHNAIFQSGAATMLTTTVVGKEVREIFQYGAGANKWICMTSYPAGW